MRRLIVGALVAFGLAGVVPAQARARATSARHLRRRAGNRTVGALSSGGQPIDVAGLEGEIVFDDFEDVYVMEADGSNVRPVADRPGPEFDAAWAPDGRWIVYRDSRRGVNENDEIYVTRPDGTGARNLTGNRANDCGPDWSPDGRTIVFNSDRDGRRHERLPRDARRI